MPAVPRHLRTGQQKGMFTITQNYNTNITTKKQTNYINLPTKKLTKHQPNKPKNKTKPKKTTKTNKNPNKTPRGSSEKPKQKGERVVFVCFCGVFRLVYTMFFLGKGRKSFQALHIYYVKHTKRKVLHKKTFKY